jgi:hypothetical protein
VLVPISLVFHASVDLYLQGKLPAPMVQEFVWQHFPVHLGSIIRLVGTPTLMLRYSGTDLSGQPYPLVSTPTPSPSPSPTPNPTPSPTPIPAPTALTLSAIPDFGKIQMTKESALQAITVANPGPSAITFSDINLVTGTQFFIDETTTTCLESSPLPVGGQCIISVFFNPTYDLTLAGTETDGLNVTYIDQGLNQSNTVSENVSGTSLILLPTMRVSQGTSVGTCFPSQTLLGKAQPLPTPDPTPSGYKDPTHHISNYGCALATISETLNYAFTTSLNVCDFNSFAMGITDSSGKVIGFDDSNDIDWVDVTKNYGDKSAYWDAYKIDSSTDPVATKLYVDSQLQFGLPVIVAVAGDPAKGGNHFIVIKGQAIDPDDNSNTYAVDDVGNQSITLLSDYLDPSFETRGSVEKLHSSSALAEKQGAKKHLTLSDQSLVNIDVSTNADFVVTDSNGNQTGFDSRTGQSYNSIPSAVYFIDGTYNIDTGIADQNISHFMYIYGSANQTYSISVVGNASGPYTVEIINYDSTGTMTHSLSVNGMATIGSLDQYTIQADGSVAPVATPTPVPATPTPTPSATPVASPTPSQNAILTLTPDKAYYSSGNVAEINVAVNSSYVLPANSTLSIQALVEGVQDQSISIVSKSLFEISTPALFPGNTTVEVSAILTTEPSALSVIDNEITSLKISADAANGLKRFWDEVAIIALEVARGIVGIFQHTTTQSLEVDKLNLIVN